VSVRQYVDAMVQDCASEIVCILGDAGPLTDHELRRALRMEQHVAMAIIDRALNVLITKGTIRKINASWALARPEVADAV